jgi:pyrroloquinoline quinone biosynthesis protein B
VKVLVLKGGEEAVPWHERTFSYCTRTPAAAAVSGDGRHWSMINLSPAVADQLGTDARLLQHGRLSWPAARSVVLTDAQVDHVSGLLGLRDGPPIHLYATPAVYEELSHSLPVLPLLQHYCGVHWHVIAVAGECASAEFMVDGQPELVFTAIATQAPLPPHAISHNGRLVGDTIAIAVHDRRSGQRLFFSPSLRGAGPNALAWMQEADCVLIGEIHAASPVDVPLYADAAVAGEGPSGLDVDHPATRARLLRSEILDALAAAPARHKVVMRAGQRALPDDFPDESSPCWAQWGIQVATDRLQIEL